MHPACEGICASGRTRRSLTKRLFERFESTLCARASEGRVCYAQTLNACERIASRCVGGCGHLEHRKLREPPNFVTTLWRKMQRCECFETFECALALCWVCRLRREQDQRVGECAVSSRASECNEWREKKGGAFSIARSSKRTSCIGAHGLREFCGRSACVSHEKKCKRRSG